MTTESKTMKTPEHFAASLTCALLFAAAIAALIAIGKGLAWIVGNL